MLDARENAEYGKVGNTQTEEVKISDDVIATIAGLATTEVEGIACMQGNLTKELVGKIGIRNAGKGVKVSIKDRVAQIDLSVIMEYGYNIPSTSKKVQEKVKAAIENMVGLEVSAVNVNIIGVNAEKVN